MKRLCHGGRWVAALAVWAALPARAAELKPRTADAFESFIRRAEQRLDERQSFLWAGESPERLRQAKQGGVVVRPAGSSAITNLPDGLAHDWVGTVFVPGATLEGTLAVMEDYNRHKELFRPEVVDSRILSRQEHDFRVFMRLRKKQVITVVLDTEHDVHYWPVAERRWRSVSKTRSIREVENAGKPDERLLPAGTGNGFLWKLYTYWRFEERDGGTWIECEAISLTRSVPAGLGWLIEPIIRNLPKDSLENTLKGSRAALSRPGAAAAGAGSRLLHAQRGFQLRGELEDSFDLLRLGGNLHAGTHQHREVLAPYEVEEPLVGRNSAAADRLKTERFGCAGHHGQAPLADEEAEVGPLRHDGDVRSGEPLRDIGVHIL